MTLKSNRKFPTNPYSEFSKFPFRTTTRIAPVVETKTPLIFNIPCTVLNDKVSTLKITAMIDVITGHKGYYFK